ncbi:PREDICTED: metabotropic glutamate receptor 5-like, partial [Nicrophorus vespilloides]|uniref:Metabotropic glutamate receptor 5-like n=1 Tax=Nicrophorus vespilloides TaxID=110193 RepID=A0ABM1M2I5_NICVS
NCLLYNVYIIYFFIYFNVGCYSDGWADRGDVTKGLEAEAWGSLSVRIHSPYVREFDQYYFGLKPDTNVRNPWFREFWQSRFGCKLKEDDDSVDTIHEEQIPKCSGNERLSDGYRQDSKLSFVIKAIRSLAYAMHAMQQDICGSPSIGLCDKLLPFNGSLFKNYLMNVSFEYGGDLVEFDENGDPPGRYDIMNYQLTKNKGGYDYVKVGEWNNRSLVWKETIQLGPNIFRKSVCSQPCEKGHYKNVQQGGKDKRCCWVCVNCPSSHILNETTQACDKCPLGYIPNSTQTECLQLPIEFMKWSDTQAIVAMAFAGFGFFTTVFSFSVFLKYNNTPVVKSSTKELSYIILAGMTLSHAAIFPILARPQMISCALSRFLPGLSFAMIYAALLTKTNRIARILAGNKKCFPSRKRLFMSTASQVVITSFLITFQILISLWMLHYQNPDVAHLYQPDRTILVCDTTPEGVLIPLTFDFFLILLCTLYALKTRNVPENFNEAKFIGFAMYTTCVIWVAFVPIYFGSDSKVITMCMCVTLSAMVTWIFLFIPKLYIILFRPERNNRSFFTTSKSIRCHIGSRVASALTEKSSVNSWKDCGKEIVPHSPQKRTLSCQTGVELLQVLLSPRRLMETYSPKINAPRITERDCCQTDSCQLKKITIRLPDTTFQ